MTPIRLPTLDRRPQGLRRSLIVGAAFAIAALAGGASPAAGHPLGGFSISVYSRLVVDDEQIRVRWVLDMAEIAAVTVIELIDTNADGEVSADEKVAYLEPWVSTVLDRIDLQVDGAELAKVLGFHELTLEDGEAGAPYLRVVMDLSATLPPVEDGASYQAQYRDRNYADYIGWREVVVSAGQGVELVDSSVPSEDRTDELRTYPSDLWAVPPNSVATFTVRRGQAPGASSEHATGGPASGVTAWPVGVLAILLVAVLLTAISLADRGDPAPRARR
ncbi:MAG: hypothetical protein WD116_04450 [Chloroflexota bacterium]